MADDKETSSKPVNEEALDALLAQWAEAELEPPVGFHERLMERLRQEQQTASENKKKHSVISLFVKRKKWMSAAAAAVLVLCCIPVVQAQFGHDITQSVPDAQMAQQKQADNAAASEALESSETAVQDSNGSRRLLPCSRIRQRSKRRQKQRPCSKPSKRQSRAGCG